MKKSKSEKLFSAYISKKKILIVDPNGPSRAGLAKALVGMGAKTNNLSLMGEYEVAREYIQENGVEVIVSEYEIGKSSGLDFIELIREKGIQPADILFVLVTSNSSQSAVAQAAEEDVDAFVLKPYTLENLKRIITKAALNKVYPSDYIKTIEEGKKLLGESKTDDAIEKFEEATKLNEKPALAHFYTGQAEAVKKLLSEAEGSYFEGLKFNDIHYKCLTGVFDTLMDQDKHKDAYLIVKKISRFFPANPKRLSQVLSLAVRTGNFSDIETFYESFKSIDMRNDELVKYVCAALVVCGKFFFKQGDVNRAKDLLKKASVSAAGRTSVLREIVSTYIQNELLEEARDALKRFPADTQKENDYIVSELITNDFEEQNPKQIAFEIKKLISEGLNDPEAYFILVKRSIEAGESEDAEQFKIEAEKKWPNQKDRFSELFSQ